MYSISYQVPAPIEAYDALHAAVTGVTASDGEGLLVHIARPTEQGFEIIEVWESREHFGAFMEQHLSARPRPNSAAWATCRRRRWSSSNFAGFWSMPRTRSSGDRELPLSPGVPRHRRHRPATRRRNRVTPLGDIVAIPLRGAWLGNRGHAAPRHRDGPLTRRNERGSPARCEYKDWRLPQWAPHHYTILFFHDEAVALAAGHRPCALCRRAAYRAFRAALSAGATPPSAKELDRALHAERLVAGTRRRRLHRRDWSDLPDGAFVLVDQRPSLVLGPALIDWTVRGYAGLRPRPTRGDAEVITPPLTLGALDAGYPVQIDGAATRLAPVTMRARTPPGPPRRPRRNRTAPGSDRIRR